VGKVAINDGGGMLSSELRLNDTIQADVGKVTIKDGGGLLPLKSEPFSDDTMEADAGNVTINAGGGMSPLKSKPFSDDTMEADAGNVTINAGGGMPSSEPLSERSMNIFALEADGTQPHEGAGTEKTNLYTPSGPARDARAAANQAVANRDDRNIRKFGRRATQLKELDEQQEEVKEDIAEAEATGDDIEARRKFAS
jgi:hypothetical protein